MVVTLELTKLLKDKEDQEITTDTRFISFFFNQKPGFIPVFFMSFCFLAIVYLINLEPLQEDGGFQEIFSTS